MASKFFYYKPNNNYYTYRDNIETFTLSGESLHNWTSRGYDPFASNPQYYYLFSATTNGIITSFDPNKSYGGCNITYYYNDLGITLPTLDKAVNFKVYVNNRLSEIDLANVDANESMYFNFQTDCNSDGLVYPQNPDKSYRVNIQDLKKGENVLNFYNISKDMNTLNKQRGFGFEFRNYYNDYYYVPIDSNENIIKKYNCKIEITKIEIEINYNLYSIDNTNCYDVVELDYDDIYFTKIRKQVVDFLDIKQKSNDSASSIRILATKNNNIKLFGISEINLKDGFINFNDKYKCSILNDNNLEFEGWFKILNIVRNGSTPLYYEVQLLNEKKNFFDKINNKLINNNTNSLDDVNFSGLNSVAKHASKYTSSSFTYPEIYYGFKNTKMYPALQLKYVVDRIFEKNGYTYTSKFFNTDYFKKLYIPHHNLKSGLINTKNNLSNYIFKYTLDENYKNIKNRKIGNWEFSEEIINDILEYNYSNQNSIQINESIDNLYSTLSSSTYEFGKISNYIQMRQHDSFDITCRYKYKIKLRFNTGYSKIVFANMENDLYNHPIFDSDSACKFKSIPLLNITTNGKTDINRIDYDISLWNDVNTNYVSAYTYKIFNLVDDNLTFTSKFENNIEYSATTNKSCYLTDDFQNVEFKISNKSIDKNSRISFNHLTDAHFSVNYGINQLKYFLIESIDMYNLKNMPDAQYYIDVEISDFSLEVVKSNLYSNNKYDKYVYNMNTFFNKLKQSDIINGLATNFNLIINENPFKTNDFLIEPFDIYYETKNNNNIYDTKIIDLTEYKNDTEEENINIYGSSNLYSDILDKNIEITYKNDTDKLNDNYQKTYSETFGRLFLNKNKKEDYTITSLFSPTICNSFNNKIMPMIYNESNGTLQFNDYNIRLISINSNEGMYDRVNNIGLEFNQSNYYYSSSFTNNYAYNMYYSNYFNNLFDNNFRMIEKEFIINDNIIDDLKMYDMIKVDDVLYRINYYEYSTNSNIVKFSLIKLLKNKDYITEINTSNLIENLATNVINIGGGNSISTGNITTVNNSTETVINNYYNNVNNYNNTVVNNNNITNNTNNIVNNTNTIVNNTNTIVNYIDESGNTYNTNIFGSGNKYILNSSDTILNPENYQYFIYGDLTLNDDSILTNKGKLSILNGELDLTGDSEIENLGEIEIITTPVGSGGTIDDSIFVKISGDTTIYNSKVFESASSINDVDIDDTNQNKFATLKNVKEYSSSYIFLNCDL